MNLLLLDDHDLIDDARALVDDDRHRHIRRILKLEAGDRLRAGRVGGQIGWAEVLASGRESTTVALDLCEPPPDPLTVRLQLAMPRPKFLGRIVQHVAAIGCKRVVLFQSARVEKTYWESRTVQPASLERHLRLGLAQARDTVLPMVEFCRSFDDLIGTFAGAESERIVVAEAAGRVDGLAGLAAASDLVVGPEGGLTDRELERLDELGAGRCSLGPRTLTVECAVSALLGRCLG